MDSFISEPLCRREQSPGGHRIENWPVWDGEEKKIIILLEIEPQTSVPRLVTKLTELFQFHAIYMKYLMIFTGRFLQFKRILHKKLSLSKKEGSTLRVSIETFFLTSYPDRMLWASRLLPTLYQRFLLITNYHVPSCSKTGEILITLFIKTNF